MHPVVLLKETPVAALAGKSPFTLMAPIKGVEFAVFGKQLVIVNHRSNPVDISDIKNNLGNFAGAIRSRLTALRQSI